MSQISTWGMLQGLPTPVYICCTFELPATDHVGVVVVLGGGWGEWMGRGLFTSNTFELCSWLTFCFSSQLRSAADFVWYERSSDDCV